jgi:putative phosphonate metabolism protein
VANEVPSSAASRKSDLRKFTFEWYDGPIMRRYAVYYAPRQAEPLARFARNWLGRDPELDAACPRVQIAGIDPTRLYEITADPRHYGFHGTLKPPFALADGVTEQEFLSRALVFAAAHPPIHLKALSVVGIDGFLAMVPREPVAELNDLAAACVRTFDRFRAPSSRDDLVRRRTAGLTPHQDELLMQWGYPFVMDEFRFHLTLTGRLSEPEYSQIHRALESLTGALCAKPVPIRDLTIFMQDRRSAPFRILARFPLGGA